MTDPAVDGVGRRIRPTRKLHEHNLGDIAVTVAYAPDVFPGAYANCLLNSGFSRLTLVPLAHISVANCAGQDVIALLANDISATLIRAIDASVAGIDGRSGRVLVGLSTTSPKDALPLLIKGVYAVQIPIAPGPRFCRSISRLAVYELPLGPFVS